MLYFCFGSSAGDRFVSACVPECASAPECTGFYTLQEGPPDIQTHQGFPTFFVVNRLHGLRGDKKGKLSAATTDESGLLNSCATTLAIQYPSSRPRILQLCTYVVLAYR